MPTYIKTGLWSRKNQKFNRWLNLENLIKTYGGIQEEVAGPVEFNPTDTTPFLNYDFNTDNLSDFTFSGDSDWTIQPDPNGGGFLTAQSGATTFNQTSSLLFSYTSEKYLTTIKFKVLNNTGGEICCDMVELFINGERVWSPANNTAFYTWQEVTVDVKGLGLKNVEFRWKEDGNGVASPNRFANIAYIKVANKDTLDFNTTVVFNTSPLFDTKLSINELEVTNEITILANGDTTHKIGVGGGISGVRTWANVALGAFVLSNIETAYNVGIGSFALEATTTGTDNIAIGYKAAKDNTTGSKLTVVGRGALSGGSSSSTSATTAIGWNSGAISSLQTGTYNSYFGAYIISVGANDSDVTYLGARSGRNTPTGAVIQNSTAVGANAKVTNSNEIVLGSTSVTSVITPNANFESGKVGGGVILKSPDGTRYKITIANGGTISIIPA